MPTDPHEQLIVKGSAYSVGAQPNTGQPANLRNPYHYPVEAICFREDCGQVVRREEMKPGKLDWMHTGRMPGESR